MTDALSTAHFGCLKGPTAPAYPGVSTFSAHMGFVSIVVFEDSEIDFRHVHAVLLIAATVEIADLASAHSHATQLASGAAKIADLSHVHDHIVSLDGEDTEL